MAKHRFDDPEFVRMLQKLLDGGKKDEFYDLVYESLVEDADYTVGEIAADPPKMVGRIRQIDGLMTRFLGQEAYEKCAKLRDLMGRITATPEYQDVLVAQVRAGPAGHANK